MTLQQTQLHIPLTGLSEKVSNPLADASPGLSVCENIQFLQDKSPTFRAGYREISAGSVSNTLTKSCLLLKDTLACITDREVRPLVLSDGASYQVPTEDFSGLHKLSPERIATISAQPPNNRSAALLQPYQDDSAANNYSFSDIYYYESAPGTEKGLAIVAVAPAFAEGHSATNYIPQVSFALIDIASGNVIDRSNLPVYIDGTTSYASNMRLVGHRGNIMCIVAGTGTTGAGVTVYYTNFTYAGFTAAWATGGTASNFLNAATDPGLLVADYDRTHADLPGTGYLNAWFAYHSTDGSGEYVRLCRITNSSGAFASAAISYGAAPAANNVCPIGISAYNITDQECILVIVNPASASYKAFSRIMSAGVPAITARTDAVSSDAAGDFPSVYGINNVYNTALTLTPITTLTADEVVQPGPGAPGYGFTCFSLLLSATWTAAVGYTETGFGYLGVGDSSGPQFLFATSAKIPEVSVYSGHALAAEPFTVPGTVKHAIAPIVVMGSDGYASSTVELVPIKSWPDNTSGTYKPYPPVAATPIVAGTVAHGIFRLARDRALTSKSQRLPKVPVSSSGSFALPLLGEADNAAFTSAPTVQTPVQSYSIYKLSMTAAYKSSVKGSYGSVYACGSPLNLDGFRVTEAAIPEVPVILTQTETTGAATSTANPVYRAMFEYETDAGQVIWSALSNPFSGPSAAYESNRLTIAEPKFRAVRPIHGVACHVFRRDSGTSTDNYIGTAYFNSIGVGYLTDSTTTADLVARAKPYYNPTNVGGGGPLPRQASAPLRYLTNHKDRIFGIDDIGRVRFTGPYTPGEHPWWSDVFYLTVPGEGFPTGLASCDGRLLVFKPDSIYLVDGDGPPESGGNGTEFSMPQRVSSIGCIEGRSIVDTPYGTFFRSPRGFELVTGGGRVSFIGEDAQATTRQYPYTVAAAYDPSTDCVKFLCSSLEEPVHGYIAGTSGGAILCFYVKSNAWTVHRIAVAEADAGGSNFSDMTVVNSPTGYVTLLSSADGRVFIERKTDTDSFLKYVDPDSGPVTARIATQDIRLSGSNNTRFSLDRLELAQLNGKVYDTTLRLAYDYNQDDDKEDSFLAANLIQRVQFLQSTPDRKQLYAVRAEVEYTVPSGTTFSAEGDADPINDVYPVPPVPLQLALNVGIQDGFPRVPKVSKN